MDLERIYNKLERMDDKLDSHLERIATLEADQKTVKGKITTLFSVIATTVTAAVAAALKYLFNHQ